MVPTKREESERRRVAQALAEAGFCLPGSVVTRSYRCGKANCVCHVSDDRLHGPYIQWTRSVDGHTVHRRLNEEQLEDYRPFFDEAQRLKGLLGRLEEITLGIVGRDSR